MQLLTTTYSSVQVAKILEQYLPKVGEKMLSNAPRVINKTVTLAEKYPLPADMAMTAFSDTTYQGFKYFYNGTPYNPYNLLQSELSTVLTRNRPLDQQLSINLLIGTLNVDPEYGYGINLASSTLGTLFGYSSSQYTTKFKTINTLVRPVTSNIISNAISDSENINLIKKKYLENYNE